jgi:GH15 family glucan-1,4-alpha-glucosidase
MASFSLEDYGIIGNFTSSALVNRVGSIDWACFPFLDSPSHFGALLDDYQGGRFQISPQGDFHSEQRYHQRTLVLETLFETPFGRAVLTDWMPLNPSLANEPIIYRKIEVLEGKINWIINCSPRFDYGGSETEAEFHGAREGETLGPDSPNLPHSKDSKLPWNSWSPQRLLFRGPHAGQIAQLFSSASIKYSLQRNVAEARLPLSSGESALFCWSWGRRIEAPPLLSFQETEEEWRKLAHRCTTSVCAFAGPWHDAITRSGIFLKLLIAPYSGSIAEAITTSVPGMLSAQSSGGNNSNRFSAKPSNGGASDEDKSANQNCDYRYAWISHGAMALQALNALGYRKEAKNYFSWLSEIVTRDGVEGLQAVYTLDGGRLLPEKELEHLKGFQNSKPVRIGNESSTQFHLDIYGQVMLAADYYYREWGALPEGLWPQLINIVDMVCQAWRRPDFGPWELRTKPQHYVGSKVLCWAALDRGISLSKRLGTPVPHRWNDEMKILHRTICDQGFDPTLQSFVTSFGSKEVDSSCLWIPIVGFLPPDDPRVDGTIAAVNSTLSEGVLVHRFRDTEGGNTDHSAPHLMSSFLLVATLALCGRADEASDRLAELCTYTSHLGFFGEQIDQKLQETSGNFPSATAHLSLINAALYVGAARGRQIPTTVIGIRGTGPRTIFESKIA